MFAKWESTRRFRSAIIIIPPKHATFKSLSTRGPGRRDNRMQLILIKSHPAIVKTLSSEMSKVEVI